MRAQRILRLCAECQHWPLALEFSHGWGGTVHCRRGEWGGLFRLVRRECVRTERPHRRQAVELLRRRHRARFLARRIKWRGLCRWGLGILQRARVGRHHRHFTVDLCHGWRCVILARRCEWRVLCRLRRRQLVRARCQHGHLALERRHWRFSGGTRPPWQVDWFISAP